MADFAALPLFTDAYLADTRHLTTDEHGAYLLLLMEAWRRPKCDLPDDDKLLARLTGLSVERWAAIKPVIMSFWKRDGRSATFRQKRLSAERAYVAKKSKENREKAVKRWNKDKKTDAVAKPDESQNDAPTPTPTPTPTPSSSLRSEDVGGGGGACASEREAVPENPDPTFREKILTACGVDPVSGLTGHGGHRLGTQADMAEAGRWLALPGLTEGAALAEVAAIMAGKRDGPPKSLSYFTPAMARLSAAITAPMPDPAAPTKPPTRMFDLTNWTPPEDLEPPQ